MSTLAFLSVLILMLIVSRYPHNHGAGYSIFLIAFSMMGAVGLTAFCFDRRNIICVVLAVLGLAIIWYLNSRNVFIEYSQYLERGMPDWGVN